MQTIDPSTASICNPPGSRLFIVCGRAVEGTLSSKMDLLLYAVCARPLTNVVLCRGHSSGGIRGLWDDPEHQANKGERGEWSAAAAAAKQPRVTAASPCFKRAAAQQGLSLPQHDRVPHDMHRCCHWSRMGPTRMLGRDPCAVHQSVLGVGSSFLCGPLRSLL
jgi:hypothetical protein